jgi:hypothetical protein
MYEHTQKEIIGGSQTNYFFVDICVLRSLGFEVSSQISIEKKTRLCNFSILNPPS